MTEQPYPPLRPQRPVRRRTRPTPWPMIAGVGVLALLAIAMLAVLLTRDPGTAAGSPSPSTSAPTDASASASGAPSSASSASTSPTGSAAGPAPELARDSLAVALVDGLSVRREPGTAAELLGTLPLGAFSFVVDGPTAAGGFSWYLVSGLGLPPNTGCAGPVQTDPFECPTWFGWAAAASETGEPWLEARSREGCPDGPLTVATMLEALGQTALGRLHCFGSEPITFRGWWPEIPEDAGLGGACTAQDAPSGWLLCQNINYNFILAGEEEDFFGRGVRVSIDPSSTAAMPERGTWVEVQAHLDDPAAQGCDDDAEGATDEESSPEQIVLGCRAELVLESARAVDGP